MFLDITRLPEVKKKYEVGDKRIHYFQTDSEGLIQITNITYVETYDEEYAIHALITLNKENSVIKVGYEKQCYDHSCCNVERQNIEPSRDEQIWVETFLMELTR
jgi:hypothetical protein